VQGIDIVTGPPCGFSLKDSDFRVFLYRRQALDFVAAITRSLCARIRVKTYPFSSILREIFLCFPNILGLEFYTINLAHRRYQYDYSPF
jgi:hypothetical protein